MNSLESLKLDFKSQIRELSNINNEKLFDNCIYVGSGDSYVAGLIAGFLTDHKCRCYSPSDLLNTRFIQDMTYCFISVTGKTKANIEVARRATRAGVKTIAVTLNTNSKLAEVCKEIVPLKITRIDTPTAGYGTFSANVVTCLQIAGITVPPKFDIWHMNGIDLSKKVVQSVRLHEVLHILGNGIFYPLALYTSLQIAEFFGATTISNRLEEFCHSPIFGMKKSHDLWILGQKEDEISRQLVRLGFNSVYFELQNYDFFAQLFESIFFLQSLILLLTEKYGDRELEYVLKKDVLRTSSDIIYNKAN